MRELKCLWVFVFIALPASLFFKAGNIKDRIIDSLFAASIIAVVTIFIFPFYLQIKKDVDRGNL